MPRCHECESRVPAGSKYCPECGAKVKISRDKDQPTMGKQARRMKAYIEYLHEEMDDAGIKYDSVDDYEE